MGIDPHFDELPPFFSEYQKKKGMLSFTREWCLSLLESGSRHVAMVKFQSSFFEAMGPSGFSLLSELVRECSKRGLLTLLDVKRCDIASTMKAYARSAFDVIGADAMTIVPYMGSDVLKPLVPWLERGHGVYSVFLSSNPSGHTKQVQRVEGSKHSLAYHLHEDFFNLLSEKGLSRSLGLVIGVKAYELYKDSLQDLSRRYSFLLPGLGAQGGSVIAPLQELCSSPEACHLFPLSRGLTGFGDPKLQRDLAEIRNFDDYKVFFKERVKAYKLSLF